MEITYFHKNLSKKEEKFFGEYVITKIGAIELLLTKFAEDAVILNVCIEKFDKHQAFQVELCLKLPTKSLVAKEASHEINRAVDLSKDRLIIQIKKHMAQLRKDRQHKSIRDSKLHKEVREEAIYEENILN
ncbi:HPF/RaiA family ribosome-associated protein [Patescibacteria group bacterium]